jgi:ankyrin repeat protein
MRADRWLCLFCIIIGAAFFFAGIRSVEADQFKADMVQYIGEKSRTSKIYVKDSKYRMEEKEDGQQIIIIVDLDMGVTRVLNPMEKKYKEMKATDMVVLMNDPIQAARFMAAKYAQKSLGIEAISGYECDKSSLYHEDQLLMTQWVSKKLMFHLKIVTQGSGGRTMELKNILEGPVDDALFQVPAGFAKIEEPKELVPTGITTSMKGTAPWARRISAGGEIRVATNPQDSIRIKVENLIKDESVVRVTAMRQGKAIGTEMDNDTDQRIILKKYKGAREEPLIGLQHKADEVVIRVEKGVVLALVKQEPLPSLNKREVEEYYLMSQEKNLSVDPKKELRLTITGDSQDSHESRVTVNFYKGSNIDKADEVMLGNGQTKTWEYPPGNGIQTLNIAVAEGSWIKVRLDQREPFQLTKDTKTQVSLAIQNNDLGKIKAFLDSGLDVNATLQGDGTTVLMKASNSADAEMVKMLLSRGADINYTNKYGWTALLKALDNHKHWIAVTPVLVKSGADVNAALKSNGYTPLWKAIGRISKNRDAAVEIIKLLLSKGADVNAPYISKDKRYSGETPLMSASKKGSKDVVKLLLSHGADGNARTKAGKTALDYAREKGHQEIVGLLEAKGGKGKAPTAEAKPRPTLSEDKEEISGEKIPPYKDAKIIKSLTDGNRTLIEMESTASPEEIMTFYKTEMTGKGWTVKLASAKGRSASLMMFKGAQIFMLSGGQRKGKTKISIRLSGN